MAARKIFAPGQMSDNAAKQLNSFHPEVVTAVEKSVSEDQVVVVGMAQNPFVKRARKALDTAGVSFTYLEYGSYFAQWKQRLAVKLWSGWPTFPQVFVNGTLVGGCKDLEAAVADGTLKKLMAQGRKAASR